MSLILIVEFTMKVLLIVDANFCGSS